MQLIENCRQTLPDGSILGDLQHTDSHSLTVQHTLQLTGTLDSVAESMTEIQYLAQTGLFLVLLDNIFLDSQRLADDLLDVFILDLLTVGGHFLQQCKQLLVSDHTCLDSLGQTVVEIAVVQSFQQVGINENSTGLMESTDNVLGVPQIDGSLAADAAVDLRKRGGGNIDVIHTTHIGSSRKACQIADNAAAQCQHQILAAKIILHHSVPQKLQVNKALGGLAGVYRGDVALAALLLQGINILGRDHIIGYDQHLAVQIDVLGDLLQDAFFDVNMVLMSRNIYCHFHNSLPLYHLFCLLLFSIQLSMINSAASNSFLIYSYLLIYSFLIS